MDNNQSLDIRRVALSNKVKIAGGAVACLVVAPLTFFVLQGLLGILALGVAGVVAFTGIQLAPWYADKVANWKMKLIVGEASKNPIETMKNIYLENMNTIGAKDTKIADFAARLDDFKDKAAGYAKKYGATDDATIRYQTVIDKMTRVLARQVQKQKEAKVAAKEYKVEIDKADDIYAMACAAESVQELGGDMEKQVFQDIKNQVAFDSVNHKFNAAVAALTVETDTEPDFSLPAVASAAKAGS